MKEFNLPRIKVDPNKMDYIEKGVAITNKEMIILFGLTILLVIVLLLIIK